MNDDLPSPNGPGTRSQLIEEASTWCFLMNGADAGQHQEAFEKWLALGAVHRQVYSEVCELHGYAESLRGLDLRRDECQENPAPDAPPEPPRSGPRWLMPLFAAGAIGLAAIAGLHLQNPAGQSSPLPEPTSSADQPRHMQSALNGKGAFRLDDGSIVTLAADSMVTVSFGPDRRELRLLKGRARFEVQHERRPFVVYAYAGSIVAHGTIFDVAILPDRIVEVHLYRGAVDVRSPGSLRRPEITVTKLVPGETTTFTAQPQPMNESDDSAGAAAAKSGTLVPYDRTPLSRIIEEANQGSTIKISLASPDLGFRLVSGTLNLRNIPVLARTLAHQLQLRVVETRHEIILATP